MKPIPYNINKMDKIVMIDEFAKLYHGEYIDMRLDRSTIPEGKYVYECRHGDHGDWMSPVTIEPSVVVNFTGTYVTDEEIEFKDKEHPRVIIQDWYFERDR